MTNIFPFNTSDFSVSSFWIFNSFKRLKYSLCPDSFRSFCCWYQVEIDLLPISPMSSTSKNVPDSSFLLNFSISPLTAFEIFFPASLPIFGIPKAAIRFWSLTFRLFSIAFTSFSKDFSPWPSKDMKASLCSFRW